MLKSEELKKEWERLEAEYEVDFAKISIANDEVSLAQANLHLEQSIQLRLMVSHKALEKKVMDARNSYFYAVHEEQEAERNAVAVPGGVVTLSEH